MFRVLKGAVGVHQAHEGFLNYVLRLDWIAVMHRQPVHAIRKLPHNIFNIFFVCHTAFPFCLISLVIFLQQRVSSCDICKAPWLHIDWINLSLDEITVYSCL